MAATFAGNPVAGSEPCAEQLAQLPECLLAGDVSAPIHVLAPGLAPRRTAQAASQDAQPRT